MAKEFVKLSLKDMCAIKHALYKTYMQKANRLEELSGKMDNLSPEEVKEFEDLDKDIKHEKALTERFEEEIRDFKDKYGVRR